MTKVFITGVSGFAGAYLAEHLKKIGNYEIFGISQSNSSVDDIKIFQGDLLDTDRISEIIAEVKPDYIYHLAALSSPRKSFDEPEKTITNNLNAELNLLQAVRNTSLREARILIVSSADIYGEVEEEYLPINENTPLNPTNPYSVSKVAQDLLALSFFKSFGLQIIRVRPFNHTGPRQTDAFVIPAFCKRIMATKKTGENFIKVGNLKARRDFTDVRDMVSAYVLAVEKGEPGEVYNLGSGVSRSMEEIVDELITLAGGGIRKEVDKSLFLPIDNPNLVCDFSKFNKLTGWQPNIPFKQTLSDTLDYWSGQL